MKKLVGLFAAVAMMTSGVALAQDSSDPSQSQGSQSQGSQQMGQDQGGSGSMGSMAGSQAMAGGNELTGQVVKSDKKMLYLKDATGAVVPLKVDKDTKFNDLSMKSLKEIQQGRDIRASFKVEGTENIATSIQPAQAGTGGSGVMEQKDTGINQPDQGGSMQQDTGGSGMEKDSGQQKGY
ncbi:hypothetical protein P2318_23700 [Myxococcaceae bacterium GXIMD 01537]